jgi:carboxymethylenebutenolidase
MKETCQSLAGQGFIALCPDLFWRIEPGLSMSSWSESEFIPPPARQKIVESVKENPQVQVHTYPGCMHAFARHTGAHYDADSAGRVKARTIEYFKAHLI